MHVRLSVCVHGCVAALPRASVHACMHASVYGCVHARVRPCVRAVKHPCMHAPKHPCMHAPKHPCMHASVHPCVHACGVPVGATMAALANARAPTFCFFPFAFAVACRRGHMTLCPFIIVMAAHLCFYCLCRCHNPDPRPTPPLGSVGPCEGKQVRMHECVMYVACARACEHTVVPASMTNTQT